jgi:hypothetical protein
LFQVSRDRRGEERQKWTIWHSASLLFLTLGILLSRWMVPGFPRSGTWLAVLSLLGLFALVAGHGVTGLWWGVLIDSHNKLSLSRLQMLLWSLVILSAYLTAVLVNVDLEAATPLAVTMPQELWLLMGLSTTSLIGTPLLLRRQKAQRVGEATKQWALDLLGQRLALRSQVEIQGKVLVNRQPEAAQWADLFQGSQIDKAGQLDLGKLQLLFFTLVLLLAYSAALATLFGREAGIIRSLPTLDPGALALLGLSHGGYLLSEAGPILPNGKSKS